METKRPSQEEIAKRRAQNILIDARARAKLALEKYKVDERNSYVNILLTGESGTGKTRIARTARKPVHIDSFDKGGTKSVRSDILQGDIIAETKYEEDDPFDPTMFATWANDMRERVREGYFNHIGTYMLDSATWWLEAVLGYIAKEKGRKDLVPVWNEDYKVHKQTITKYLQLILNLPCDVIVTGHLEGEKTLVNGEMIVSKYRFHATGKSALYIPTLFDERWITITNDSPDGVKYRILTQNIGRYDAKTRIGEGVFEKFEDQNIKALLRKAKISTADKPSLFATSE